MHEIRVSCTRSPKLSQGNKKQREKNNNSGNDSNNNRPRHQYHNPSYTTCRPVWVHSLVLRD